MQAAALLNTENALEVGPDALLSACIDFISDTLLVTQGNPVEAPGPRVIFVNRAFERMTGYSAEEILGKSPRLLQGPLTSRTELRRIRDALESWQPIRAELINYRKGGEPFFVEMDIVPVKNAHGAWTNWVSVQRDVSARKKKEAEQQARERLRYESLGTLSYGIAHDFNNIIAAILGNVEIATADMLSGASPRSSVAQIEKAAMRARGVVAKILSYARRRPEASVPVDLVSVIHEVVDLLRAVLPDSATLEARLPEGRPHVLGDASELCQMLLNLGMNATHALEGRPGRVDLTLGALPSSGHSGQEDCAFIEVADTGCGMDAPTRSKIFEPYFSTKQSGQGTGLGLAVVWGIVAAHRGSIAVDSEPGKGTRFRIVLPMIAAPDRPASATPGSVQSGRVGQGEHVLVVDDDDVITTMLEGVLMRWGFRVTTCTDPVQACKRFKKDPSQFDIVITDLNMPRLSGLEFAGEILSTRNSIPVLLGSGNVSQELVRSAAEIGISAVFPKEFAVERLGALIGRALAPARSGTNNPLRSQDGAHIIAPEGTGSMQTFLVNNREDLVERCREKVARRSERQASSDQLVNGIPLFLEQLIQTLRAEAAGEEAEGLAISGPAGGDPSQNSQIGAMAAVHGRQLLDLGYSVDQVVHDYGDLCQAITDLAVERDAPFSIQAYRTLNRCLDNAIADAVTEFASQRDAATSAQHASDENRRMGFLAHELRNHLNVAFLALSALKAGSSPVTGSTGAMLKRSLLRLDDTIAQTLSEVRAAARAWVDLPVFAISAFIEDAAGVAALYAKDMGCTLSVSPVDPQVKVQGARALLLDALTNLLQNAFKFTAAGTEVGLTTRLSNGRVLIEVRDHCGGLPPGVDEQIFTAFRQARNDERGLGLGLAIAKQSVEHSGGTLTVRNIAGFGCVFTIDLPAQSRLDDAKI